MRRLLILFPLISQSLSNAFSLINQPKVEVKNGTIVGIHNNEYNQDMFLGVPFAQSPVGDLRFQNPRSLNVSFSQPHVATEYAPECVGYGGDSNPYPVDEDCLYLNIIRPSCGQNGKLPVAVWIHGGGFVQGGTQDLRYNLSYFVSNSVDIGKPVIAVSIPYRLSAWGFLHSSEMKQRGDTNMGLRDQRLALHWLQENIAAFGGAPDQITIWGESAGAVSVGFHLTAFNGRDDGLFRGAIMESGNPINVNSFRNLTVYQALYDSVVQLTPCAATKDTLDCLRRLPFRKLNSVLNSTTAAAWQPIIDGDIISRLPSTQLRDGSFVKVPIITGANTDEGTTFAPHGIDDTPSFVDLVSSDYGSLPLTRVLAQSVAYHYKNSPSYRIPSDQMVRDRPFPSYLGEEYRRGAAYFGDAIMVAPRRATCEAWARYGVPAYSYRFNTLPAGLTYITGVTHFQEVAFVMGNTHGVGYERGNGTNPFAHKPSTYFHVSKLMGSSWASFIHDQNPNAFRKRVQGTDHWPRYKLEAPENMVWDAEAAKIDYTEPDTFRHGGIEWIIEHAEDYHR